MLKEKLGFDDAFNYKEETDLNSALKKLEQVQMEPFDISYESVFIRTERFLRGHLLNAYLVSVYRVDLLYEMDMTRTRILPSKSDRMNRESYPVSEIDNSYLINAYRINCCIRYRFERLRYCSIWYMIVLNFTGKC